LFSFVAKRDGDINFTSAGYFSKAITSLITKQGSLWEFFHEEPQHVENLLYHIYSKSVAEIIEKLLIVEGMEKNPEDSSPGTIDPYQSDRLNLVGELFKIFDSSTNSEVLENIAGIIRIILSNTNETDRAQNKHFETIAQEACKRQYLQKLLEKMNKGGSENILYSATILKFILQF
jgi:hypothetical protein